MTNETILSIMILVGIALGMAGGYLIPMAVRSLVNSRNRLHQKPEMPDLLKKDWHRWLIILADAFMSALICFLYPGVTGILWVLIMQNVIICVMTDHFIRIIANEEVLIILVMAVLIRVTTDGFGSLLGALGAMGLTVLIFGGSAFIMMKLRNLPGVGAGDLKYAMALSVAIGWQNIGWFLAGMAAALIILCVIGIESGKLAKSSYFPMCPEISAGLMTALILPVFSEVLTLG